MSKIDLDKLCGSLERNNSHISESGVQTCPAACHNVSDAMDRSSLGNEYHN